MWSVFFAIHRDKIVLRSDISFLLKMVSTFITSQDIVLITCYTTRIYAGPRSLVWKGLLSDHWAFSMQGGLLSEVDKMGGLCYPLLPYLGSSFPSTGSHSTDSVAIFVVFTRGLNFTSLPPSQYRHHLYLATCWAPIPAGTPVLPVLFCKIYFHSTQICLCEPCSSIASHQSVWCTETMKEETSCLRLTDNIQVVICMFA